jgi:hypothetical protein
MDVRVWGNSPVWKTITYGLGAIQDTRRCFGGLFGRIVAPSDAQFPLRRSVEYGRQKRAGRFVVRAERHQHQRLGDPKALAQTPAQ